MYKMGKLMIKSCTFNKYLHLTHKFKSNDTTTCNLSKAPGGLFPLQRLFFGNCQQPQREKGGKEESAQDAARYLRKTEKYNSSSSLLEKY